ncbi:MAG: hypothetical protein SNI70_11345 [Rikenellaceae bacterium]
MKFGFRKPSFKKSLAAATRGAITRSIRKAIIPGYGQKGMGIASPKKYLYNRLYSMTTVDTVGLLLGKHSNTGQGRSSRTNTIRDTQQSYKPKQKALDIRNEGLRQYDIISKFIIRCSESSLNPEAIKKIHGRANRYINKGVLCGEDLYQFAESDLRKLMETAATVSTVNECKIAISIISQLREGVNFDDIISNVKKSYTELAQAAPTPFAKNRQAIPEELLNNPNGEQESLAQHKILMDFYSFTENKKYGLFIIEAKLKMINMCSKRHPDSINLFDFVKFKLSEQAELVKREQTKAQYRLAYNIIDMLDQRVPLDDICKYLDDIERSQRR